MSEKLNKQLGTSNVVWNLDDLYSSIKDERIAGDIDRSEQEAALLKDNFAGRLAELDPSVFVHTLKRLERIDENLGRLATYAFLHFSTQVKNEEAGAFLQRIREVAGQINREIVFFELEWSKMGEETAQKFLTDRSAAEYSHYLKKVRRRAAHLLSQVEETILIEFEPVGCSSWTNLFTKVMAHIQFGEDGRDQEKVLADLYSPERDIRKKAATELTEGLKSQLHILTHIFNTLLANKMIDDRLRGYPTWISYRNLDNELDEQTVNALINTTTSRYDIVHDYYHLKTRVLGVDILKDYDRYAPLPNLPDQLVSWQQCREMVLEAFFEFSPQMAEIASLFFEKNWIHAPLLEGKRGGAFAYPALPDGHPYVMVNYTGNLNDVSTVAHELGHGVHQYLAKDKGYFNSNTPLVLAETASVFAELLVFHKQLRLLDDSEQKRAFICLKLESIFATVFRQIAMNRFENKIHTCRRDEGELSSEMFSRFWMETQGAMFGDSVELTEDYATWWAYIPHFLHSPGYVYSYAFGELLVLAMYKVYQSAKERFVPQYMHLLAQGGSSSPYELLEPFDIDLNDPKFWEGGFSVIDDMLQDVQERSS